MLGTPCFSYASSCAWADRSIDDWVKSSKDEGREVELLCWENLDTHLWPDLSILVMLRGKPKPSTLISSILIKTIRNILKEFPVILNYIARWKSEKQHFWQWQMKMQRWVCYHEPDECCIDMVSSIQDVVNLNSLLNFFCSRNLSKVATETSSVQVLNLKPVSTFHLAYIRSLITSILGVW